MVHLSSKLFSHFWIAKGPKLGFGQFAKVLFVQKFKSDHLKLAKTQFLLIFDLQKVPKLCFGQFSKVWFDIFVHIRPSKLIFVHFWPILDKFRLFFRTYLGLSKIFLTFCPNCESAIVNPNPIPPLVIGMVITLSESGTPGPEPPDPRRSALLGLKFNLENWLESQKIWVFYKKGAFGKCDCKNCIWPL